MRAGIGGRESGARASARWFFGQRGDMVWNALVVIAVLLPLMGLTLDVPRYFVLRSRLQAAVDAAAEAAARAVDVRHFSTTGETRLDPNRYADEVFWTFQMATADLWTHGYHITLHTLAVDEAADTVTVGASGTLRPIYNLLPPVYVNVRATSWFRMIQR
ncbi:MAG: pilus assembly protein TadG-related protein [Anaerolineae bacterium]|nr:pilus assembly protein TadG-related protein [Anaerolineae bacterium]